MSDALLNLDQPAAETEYTVSELAGAIKCALEDAFGRVRLRGEISGFKGAHASGHCYFGIKDDKARIDAVIWRATYQKLAFKPEEGLEVVVKGRVSAFPGSSKYQIVVDSMEPAGAGALMALLEARKKKLAAEGLFDESRKRKLPFLPAVVGVVTSPTGAVIRDIVRCLEHRFPTRVLVWPVRVQGETSAAEVSTAIRGFNALPPDGPIPRPEVLIVARGGGSLEDLWGFNEEAVVRAAAESAIPLISAVGHETDWTLIDLAADARASTPTMAAEWVSPKRGDLADAISAFGPRLRGAVRRMLSELRNTWRAAARGTPRLQDLLGPPRQRFDACERRLSRALLANANAHRLRYARVAARLRPSGLADRLRRARDRLTSFDGRARLAWRNRLGERRRGLEACSAMLESLSYRNVLKRGYAVVRKAGVTVRSAANIGPQQRLDVEFADGVVAVESLPETDATSRVGSPSAGNAAAPRPAKRRREGQGSLF